MTKVRFEPITNADELWDGEMRPFTVGGVKLLLIRLGDEVRAYEDRCAHLGVPLSKGKLDQNVLTCSAHHWQYDVVTGKGINPDSVCLKQFPVKLEDGVIFVEVGHESR